VGGQGRNERTEGMIWNPWKEIAKLREQLGLYVDMAFEEGQKVSFLQTNKEVLQGRNDALVRTLERHEDDLAEMSKVLQDIAAQEKPTSNATVKRICKMAREALK
jgi:hypothetical protein